MDNILSQQILPEQRRILEALAHKAAKKSPRFLELGSWAGDSAIVLGRVAKEYGGKLYCVDWWKGNEGTDLHPIAEREDMFSHFWKRICDAGLEDTVIPIRTSTDQAVELMKHLKFDLIFIDADHRYKPVLKDIRNYAPLVKKGTGILCGHDCEGYLSDFDPAFLKKGRNQDCYETVHCGVVLAVGEAFETYSIHFGVWSVRRRKGEKDAWSPVRISIPELQIEKQPPPPPFAHSENYNVFRYGKMLYAIPFGHDFPISSAGNGSQEIMMAPTLKKLEKQIGQTIQLEHEFPHFLETYQVFNLVGYKGDVYGLHHSLGPFDLTKAPPEEIEKHRQNELLLVEPSLNEARAQVDFLTPQLVQEGYKYFNIVKYKSKHYAVAQALGAIEDWSTYDFNRHIVAGKCFISDSIGEAEKMIELYYRENPLRETFNWFKNQE